MRIILCGDGKISEITYVKGTEKDIETLCKFIMNNRKIIKSIEITGKEK